MYPLATQILCHSPSFINHKNSCLNLFSLPRHQLSDPSKPEFSSDYGSKVDTEKVNMDATKRMDEQQENVNLRASDGEEAGQPSYDCSKYIVDFPEDYYCNSPGSGLRPSSSLKDKHMADYACNSRNVPFVQEASQSRSFGTEVNMQGLSQMDQNKDAKPCGWDSLISDASDLLIFESPNDTDSYKKSIDSEMNFYNSTRNDMQDMHPLCAVGSGEQIMEGNEQETLSTQPGDGIEIVDNTETSDIVAGPSMNNPGEKIDYEVQIASHFSFTQCLIAKER